jgi:SAM-dependent methyltransferase
MSKKLTMVEAKSLAQAIAFAPLTFQAVRAMLAFGIIKAVDEAAPRGVAAAELQQKLNLPYYTVATLTEVGLTCGIFEQTDGRLSATKTAQCLLYDDMTRVNMDFVNDVCYQGAFYLKESFEKGRPEGLKVFGGWPTVYEGLAALPPQTRKSWFAFDHFYSDNAFDDIIKIILARRPRAVFDTGCNTGKFALSFFKAGFKGSMTLLDLPRQLAAARQNLEASGFADSCTFYPINMLDAKTKFPPAPDAILMSQFLDCFAPREIVMIIKKAAAVMGKDSRLYILEPFWDKQRFDAAKLALTHTSLYFTAIANGSSKMYSQAELENFIKQAELKLLRAHQNIGAHEYTLLECGIG